MILMPKTAYTYTPFIVLTNFKNFAIDLMFTKHMMRIYYFHRNICGCGRVLSASKPEDMLSVNTWLPMKTNISKIAMYASNANRQALD